MITKRVFKAISEFILGLILDLKRAKCFVVLEIIFVSLVALLYILSIKTPMSDSQIIDSYYCQREKCNFLKDLLNDIVEDGKRINLEKIPNDLIDYSLINIKGGQLFCYNLKGNNYYSVKVTLSNECNISNVEYGFIEKTNLRDYILDYKEEENKHNKFVQIITVAMIMISTVVSTFVQISVIQEKREKEEM